MVEGNSSAEPSSSPKSSRSAHVAGVRDVTERGAELQARLKAEAEGPQYLTFDELTPFAQPPDERFAGEMAERLSSPSPASPGSPGNKEVDWVAQFRAMDDFRRLMKHTPRLLIGKDGGRLRKLVGCVVSMADNLRSTLAKNGLRCVAELFSAFGTTRYMDLELENCLQVAFKRSVDKNTFIAEEADITLIEIIKAANEAKLPTPLLSSAASRRPEVRAKAVRCLAMLAQRLAARGQAANRDLKAIAELCAKALSDANADVRQSAKIVAVALDRAAADGALDDCSALAKLRAAIPAGIDVNTFDAFDMDAGARTTPSAQGTARGFSRQGAGAASGGQSRVSGSPKS